MTRTASCSCGQLQIICEGEPIRRAVCHCLASQRRTGSLRGTGSISDDSNDAIRPIHDLPTNGGQRIDGRVNGQQIR
jgi:hypothetical protein